MKVFTDTSAFYALASSNDIYHQQAKALLKKSFEEHNLVTTSYIIVETLALLQNRGGYEAAISFLDSIGQGNWLEILWISESLHLKGCELFTSDSRQGSFVDCVSFVTMRHFAISHFFGFDEHFRKAGFLNIWPD